MIHTNQVELGKRNAGPVMALAAWLLTFMLSGMHCHKVGALHFCPFPGMICKNSVKSDAAALFSKESLAMPFVALLLLAIFMSELSELLTSFARLVVALYMICDRLLSSTPKCIHLFD